VRLAKRFHRVLVVAGSAGALVLTTACGPMLAGSAAVIGQSRITDETLATQVSAVTVPLRVPESQQVSAAILNRMITQQLVFDLAAGHQISVSPEEVQAFISEQVALAGGDRQAFEQGLLRRGIPPAEIEGTARATLLVARLGPVLAPGKGVEEQELATVLAVAELSRKLDTRVSPRFGTWDPELLQVTDTPNDLSTPAPRRDVQALRSAQLP